MSILKSRGFEEEVELRLANADDGELIADLSRATFFDTFYPHNTPANMNLFLKEQFTRQSLIAELQVPSNIFVLAYVGDEVAGYMKLRDGQVPPDIQASSTLEIARLYATQKMVGKGVGRVLMQMAHDTARNMARESLWLAVWEQNKRALSFYEKWGFKIVGKQVFVLGMDLQNDWIMQKIL